MMRSYRGPSEKTEKGKKKKPGEHKKVERRKEETKKERKKRFSLRIRFLFLLEKLAPMVTEIQSEIFFFF